MKKIILDFVRRGLIGGGFGPLVLSIVYFIINRSIGLENLDVNEVCIAIISLYILAFIVGGMNSIYQIERLPIMMAILIHGIVLYIGYLATYVVNDWIELGAVPIIIFTAIFIVGYFIIWAVIYTIIKKKTLILNNKK